VFTGCITPAGDGLVSPSPAVVKKEER